MSQSSTPPALVSIRDAAPRLGLSEPALRAHLQRDNLPSVRLGRRVFIHAATLRRLEGAE